MRRIVFAGAVTPILTLGFVAWAETALLAQSEKLDAPKAASSSVSVGTKSGSLGASAAVGTPFGAEAPAIDEPKMQALDASPARQRFIELSKKKAYTLDEEQLKHEVEVMEADVRELEAWAKADEAIRILHEVVDKHPNTHAARAASASIRQLEDRRKATMMGLSPMPRPEGFVPRPDRDFRRSDGGSGKWKPDWKPDSERAFVKGKKVS